MGGNGIEKPASGPQSSSPGGVTEVFVTQVSSDKEAAFKEWASKIHEVEAKFPGFQGMYLQAPEKGKSRNWLTFLKFDTAENLDRWLGSEERKAILRESSNVLEALDSHRLYSPYGGWFTSLSGDLKLPSVWKQTMIVLLVLFPIVMLEFKWLSPLTQKLDLSLATFIGNAISVSLVAWPMMPIAIWFLEWWLLPKGSYINVKNILGVAVLLFAYLLEIVLFWK